MVLPPRRLLVACHSVSAGGGRVPSGRRPLHPHLWRLGGARVPSGCPLRASPAKSVWLTTSASSSAVEYRVIVNFMYRRTIYAPLFGKLEQWEIGRLPL